MTAAEAGRKVFVRKTEPELQKIGCAGQVFSNGVRGFSTITRTTGMTFTNSGSFMSFTETKGMTYTIQPNKKYASGRGLGAVKNKDAPQIFPKTFSVSIFFRRTHQRARSSPGKGFGGRHVFGTRS